MRLILCSVLAIGISVPAYSAPITNNPFSDFVVEDFSAQRDLRGPGPHSLSVGSHSITWTGSSALSGIEYDGDYALTTHGQWTNTVRQGYSFVQDATMTFSFATPVSGIGGFMDYSGSNPALLEALDSGNNVLETFDIVAAAPIPATPTFNDGAFRGFARATADIAHFRVSGRVVLDDLAIENPTVTPPPSPVPVPSGLALLAPVIAAALWWRRC